MNEDHEDHEERAQIPNAEVERMSPTRLCRLFSILLYLATSYSPTYTVVANPTIYDCVGMLTFALVLTASSLFQKLVTVFC